MNIYELTAEMQEIEAILEANGGEITEELDEKMRLNAENLSEKLDSYNALYRKFKATASTINDEIVRLTALGKTAKNSANALVTRLRDAMTMAGIVRLEGKTCKAYTRTTNAIEVDERAIIEPYENELSDIARVLPPYIVLDYKVSKTALKDLEELPNGAERFENVSLILK